MINDSAKTTDQDFADKFVRDGDVMCNNPEPVVRIDKNGNIISYNSAAEKLLGDSPNKSIYTILPDLKSLPIDNFRDGDTRRIKSYINEKYFLFTVVKETSDDSIYLYGSDITEIENSIIALKESETKFRTLFEASSDAIMLHTRERYIDCNQAAIKIFGCENKEEFYSRHPADFSPPTQPDGTDSLTMAGWRINDAFKYGSNSFGWMHMRLDGTVFPAEVFLSAMKIGGDDVILSSVRDVTERKKFEESLIEANRTTNRLVDSLPIGVAIIGSDKKVIHINDTALMMIKRTRDFVVGKQCNMTICPVDEVKCPVWDLGEEVTNQEKELVSANGKKIPVLKTAIPFKYNGQNVIIVVFVDISKRKGIERELQKLIERYTAMINTVPALMFAKDVDDKYIEVNEAFCKFVGKEKSEIIGKSTFDVHSKEQAERYYADDLSVIKTKKGIINQEEQNVDHDGKTSRLSSTKVPLYDDDGNIYGLVGFAQDITEQYLSRQQLVQSDKLAAIGQLAAGVAHEINNPIGYINSNLNTMNRYIARVKSLMLQNSGIFGDDSEGVKKMLDDFGDAIAESLEGTDRVRKIVADLKSFSRVDRASKEQANINDGIETTLNVVWNELKYKADVQKEYGEIPKLLCIPNQLNQVFMNILVNAAHAINKERGLITIKTSADKDNIYVSISDDGIGIPKENIKKLFEPFFTTKEVGKGTGLGLSLAYDIIKKHNGRIEVSSEPGVGTEFRVILPLGGLDEDEK